MKTERRFSIKYAPENSLVRFGRLVAIWLLPEKTCLEPGVLNGITKDFGWRIPRTNDSKDSFC